MCGIVGAVGLDEAPRDAAAILAELRHRGPDSAGHRFRDGAWLGVTRLRILDLRTVADQPMVDDDSELAIVFNGEIYNYVELRTELEALGHSFRTNGDTEVLLRGYVEWGEDVFGRCNGMWAVAIDDPKRDGVLLSRDRFGEKPLFFGRGERGSWWFASEPGALRRAGVGTGRVNADRVLGLLVVGDVEDPSGSYFEGIGQLPPGSLATLTTHGPRGVRAWWDVANEVARSWDDGVSDDDVLPAIDEAVRIRLRSDVRVGTSLSGGVDSSTVVASIRTLDESREIHAFTAGFPGAAVDETPRAAAVAADLGVILHQVEPTVEDFVHDLDRLVLHQGGPVESPSVYAQWCVMRRAAEEGVVVLLDGQGADESWGGYPKHLWFAVGEMLMAGRPDAALGVVRRWRSLGPVPRPDVRQVVGLALPGPARSRLVAGAARFSRRGLGLGPALREAIVADPQNGGGVRPLLARAATADVSRVILPRLLRYADRNSMAWSRELRLPYLDPRVVALALASGWRAGLASGWTKATLRRAASLRLRNGIAWRREKTAYDVPEDAWLQAPATRSALEDAVDGLYRAGVLARRDTSTFSPWHLLSLGRFIESFRLSL